MHPKLPKNTTIIMSMILAFAVIHLGVSSGIIHQDRGYGDIFRPEIGLAAYNIVISVLAIVVGCLGLLTVPNHRIMLNNIVAVMSAILAIFALVSLITALIINSKSFSYVNSHFTDNMALYFSNDDAKNIVNQIQTKYECCGRSNWLDWASIQAAETISTTVSTISTTTLISTTMVATTTTTGQATVVVTTQPATMSSSSTTVAPTTTTSSAVTIVPTTTTSSAVTIVPTTTTSSAVTIVPTTTTSSAVTIASTTIVAPGTTIITPVNGTGSAQKIAILDLLNFLDETSTSGAKSFPETLEKVHDESVLDPHLVSVRRRRQTQSNQQDPISLLYSLQFSIPATCCISFSSGTNVSCSITSMPTLDDARNQLFSAGCYPSLIRRANQQDMGIGVINCFLIVLALLAVPVLLSSHSKTASTDYDQNNGGFQSDQNNMAFNHSQTNGPTNYGQSHRAPIDSQSSFGPQLIYTRH